MTYRLWWTVGYTCTSEREFLAAKHRLLPATYEMLDDALRRASQVARAGGVRGRGATISLTDDTAVAPAAAPVTTREGWRLIGGTLRDQWMGVTVGVVVGLLWTLAKVSVPRLVGNAIWTEDVANKLDILIQDNRLPLY